MRLLLLGATGLVGRTALKQALAKDSISEVVAPSRRPLVPQNKLVNPVNLPLDELAPRVKSWDVDAVICALGTTKAKAGSQEAFRETRLPVGFCRGAELKTHDSAEQRNRRKSGGADERRCSDDKSSRWNCGDYAW
jgi:hypothetical protein